MLTTCLTWADNYGATLQPASESYVKRITRRPAYPGDPMAGGGEARAEA